MHNLTQPEIERLDAEQYSMFLAYGEIQPENIKESDYESFLKSQRLFDL
tara:strand:+ start:3469 stop:3615 length:147 start_codon:yes stop_codon:yes gene_type:complete